MSPSYFLLTSFYGKSLKVLSNSVIPSFGSVLSEGVNSDLSTPYMHSVETTFLQSTSLLRTFEYMT
jgi:hypothetical protein